MKIQGTRRSSRGRYANYRLLQLYPLVFTACILYFTSISANAHALCGRSASRITTSFSQQLPIRNSLISTGRDRPASVSPLHNEYGRGSEIWPECNEFPVALEQSFPGGIIPEDVRLRLSQISLPDDEVLPLEPNTSDSEGPSGRKRKIAKKAVSRILRGAAGASGSTEKDALSGFDKSPLVLSVVLVALGLVRVSDLIFVVSFSGYLVLGGLWNTGGRVIPARPPPGHIPALVSDPLGHSFTSSRMYRLWLRAGAALGLFLPLLAVAGYSYKGLNLPAAGAVGRPLFLIGCQAMTENTLRRLKAPLPFRILVPLAYNAKRLDPVWNWALSPHPLTALGRLLAVLNGVYWTANLFGFLLPTATMRYMRAHFFCVEAEEVKVRNGSAVGLLP